MNNNIDPKIARTLLFISIRADKALQKVNATIEAMDYQNQQKRLVGKIEQTMKSSEKVEDLIYLEMALQKLDERRARTEQEKGSIRKAQIDYRELTYAVAQMRKAPLEYFNANRSIDSKNLEKMPGIRGPAKLRSNRTRLQNHALFGRDEDVAICEARIILAKKTESMLQKLHKDLWQKLNK